MCHFATSIFPEKQLEFIEFHRLVGSYIELFEFNRVKAGFWCICYVNSSVKNNSWYAVCGPPIKVYPTKLELANLK